MILFFAGLALMLVGIVKVLIEAGRNWSRWRGDMRERNTESKGKVSHIGIVLIAVGAALALIATSISPPPASPPVQRTQ